MIERIDSLPPMPKIAQKILALKVVDDEGERELFSLIEKDPALMAKIIGLSNSPLFFRGRTVLTIHDAVAVLGSKRIKMTALGFAMMSSIAKSGGLLDRDELWKHSLSIAMMMPMLAKYMPNDLSPLEEDCYLAGLLHDIGFLVLNYLNTNLSDQLCTRMTAASRSRIEEIEAEILDTNHSELGSRLARHWSLPEKTVAVLRYHHSPTECPEVDHQPLIYLVNFAEKLLPAFDVSSTVPTKIDDNDWRNLGINPLLADEIMGMVKIHIDQVAAINI